MQCVIFQNVWQIASQRKGISSGLKWVRCSQTMCKSPWLLGACAESYGQGNMGALNGSVIEMVQNVSAPPNEVRRYFK
jgi:hypothetical protein